jgi:choline-sulfatase
MDRRKFLYGTASAVGALGLDALDSGSAVAENQAQATENTEPKRRPNVLLVMSDQHRRNCMGAAGDPVAHTPNLDRLAGQSVRFTNAYCTNPVCAPSRASMLTGLYSHNLYPHAGDQPYSPRRKTVAEHFSRAGYLSALIGKMHFVDAQVHGFQYQLEFNEWLQVLGPRGLLYANETYYPNSGAGLPQISSLWKTQGDPWADSRKFDGRLGPVAVGKASEMAEADHFESFVARESIHFLEAYGKSDEPFFLVTSFLKPHDPFMPAERFANMFREQDMSLPPSWGKADLENLPEQVAHDIRTSHVTPELLHAPAARQRIASYYGNLAQTDDCVGQVLDALTRLDLDRNTIVLYLSDHGEMLGDLGLWNKFQFYEGSCGVPLMVRIPGASPAVCETPVSLISLAVTLAELCSVPLPGSSDGRSFAGLISNPASREAYGPVFAEFDLGRPGEKYMIRDGDLKYSFWVHDRAELYDLKNDPQEMRNLAARPEHQATVNRFRERLFSWYRPPAVT